ncbi:YqcI/YcgG family protein [Gillisia sp. M10.2A]|uniref:YqcI/YcgG family protein n=1 Tax=Gillisia lutea TaxID=2909668 RepID=A0ABS9EFM1_9FLAO|nr:guanitoxin biosynthesis heme-dependent pre-guanitoxin N-hydroxylase GntA [Gillisia lutea]MCF4101047.1 YqcI/YcgG family protein [Gillisia lutea]
MEDQYKDIKEDSEDAIREFILDDHPCVMAQSLVADDNLTIRDYKNLANDNTPSEILQDLKIYIESIDEEDKKFQTFIATFENDAYENELDFENALWKLLSELNEIDSEPWDENTSSDPSSSKFSFSLLGNSFYIVGMHPNSSRKARSTPFPMIVFNLHSQFELLRNAGRYTRVRDIIRRRDKAFQGSINPMLEDFGSSSEARQYSGRKVEDNWKCPYSFKQN